METTRALIDSELQSRIREAVQANEESVLKVRRHIHAFPELSFEEHKTMSYISELLADWDIEHEKGVAETGIVARIGQRRNGRVIALRADIDALPIQEENDVPYRSTNNGVMHACGHDVHTACLMGAIKVLKDLEPHIEHEIRCIFQPAEEKLPGGASLMIAEGVLRDPDVNLIIAQHVFPDLPAGQVGFKPGLYMASADEIYITINGKGGHGATPHLNIDPVLISAHVITALQQVASRHAPSTIPSVLTIGKVIANGATNITPEKVAMEGTFRTLNEEWRKEAHVLIKRIVEDTCKAMGANADVDIKVGYPFLQNDEELTAQCKDIACDFLGKDNVVDLPIRLTAEDFAFYSQEVPACFYRLGTNSSDGKFSHSVHTPRFNIDESALNTGSGMMAYMAMRLGV